MSNIRMEFEEGEPDMPNISFMFQRGFDMRDLLPLEDLDIVRVTDRFVSLSHKDQERVGFEGEFEVLGKVISGTIYKIIIGSEEGIYDDLEIDASVLNGDVMDVMRGLRAELSGADYIAGGNWDTSNDYLLGYGGNDTISGGNGEDTIVGGRGEDWLRGISENDRMLGGPGNDALHGGDSVDFLHGGGGDDTIQAGLEASTDGEREVLIGGRGDDSLVGSEGNDRLAGRAGDDTVEARDGNDMLFGARNDDILRGGRGEDLITSGPGEDVLVGGLGDDRLFGGGGRDEFRFSQNSGNDKIFRFDPEMDRISWMERDVSYRDIQVSEAEFRGVEIRLVSSEAVITIPSLDISSVSEDIFLL